MSGIHPTVTGVALGLLTPTRGWVSDRRLRAILGGVIAFRRVWIEQGRGRGAMFLVETEAASPSASDPPPEATSALRQALTGLRARKGASEARWYLPPQVTISWTQAHAAHLAPQRRSHALSRDRRGRTIVEYKCHEAQPR